MMKKILLLCLPFAATVAMAQKTDQAAKYAGLITPQALKEKLTILASADMEGRETASPGQKKAAAWIEDQFKKFGLQPGNGSSYQQLYPVYFDAMSDQLLRVNGKTFSWDKDYNFALTGIYKGYKTYNNIVFAGYGFSDDKTNDYAGLDVKEKIVVVLEGGAAVTAPTGRAGRFFNPNQPKIDAAKKNGAVGLLIVSAGFPRRAPSQLRSRMLLQSGADPVLFTATISDEVASALIGRTNKVAFADFKSIAKGNYVSELQIGATKTTETKERQDQSANS